MSKMKDIATQLQEVDETLQRAMHVNEYLETKLKRKEKFIENLQIQLEHMQQQIEKQNDALNHVRRILDTTFGALPGEEIISTEWKYNPEVSI